MNLRTEGNSRSSVIGVISWSSVVIKLMNEELQHTSGIAKPRDVDADLKNRLGVNLEFHLSVSVYEVT